eukprot:TRINITY_DN4543_c0_g1_i1.p1 TRINITY_DN4543_c0_g1~~TRINITY_DN4543_c0_g1_i1.p1  ORF type:complete len:450 (-),score=100.14 TRINITY_DN4543_c0_g1_i1:92-1441(-)
MNVPREIILFCTLFAIALSAINDDLPPVKVGILHSQTGTIGGSERPLKDVLLYLIKLQNEKGGVLDRGSGGRRLVPVIKDPQSNWPLFAELARELITTDQVDVVFGCWTSVSRKSVLSVFEELNHLLIYPVQYEGEECSKNIFYTGAAPNQQAIPAVDYFKNSLNVSRFVLIGTDYVYPRTTNSILNSYLLNYLGLPSSDVTTIFTPFSHSDWTELVAGVIKFHLQGAASGKKTGVISTINGDANTFFYSEIARQFAANGLTANDIPIVAFSVGEAELSVLSSSDLALLEGQLASWNYFMSINNTLNKKFIDGFLQFQADNNITQPERNVVNDPMEAHYIGFNIWVSAVEQAGTTAVEAVIQSMYNRQVLSLSGFNVSMGTNHHLVKPVFIGAATKQGQFSVVYNTSSTVPAVPWSPYINDPANVLCDWSYPYVCSRCTSPNYTPVMTA